MAKACTVGKPSVALTTVGTVSTTISTTVVRRRRRRATRPSCHPFVVTVMCHPSPSPTRRPPPGTPPGNMSDIPNAAAVRPAGRGCHPSVITSVRRRRRRLPPGVSHPAPCPPLLGIIPTPPPSSAPAPARQCLFVVAVTCRPATHAGHLPGHPCLAALPCPTKRQNIPEMWWIFPTLVPPALLTHCT